MKLGELRAAIRKTKGNPWFDCYPFPGTDKTFRFYLQKTPLLEELEKAYPGGKGAETQLSFDAETGQLKPEKHDFQGISKDNPAIKTPAPPHEDGPAPKNDDDLLLDDEPAAAPAKPTDDLSDLLV
ncbi:hypothetical protein CK222_21735 [Mesorhizobium sp. WSM3866]|uniref:hypothetical protein n=1 Tax=Mesorhizobium sp. WSM3866 TaxID=422271 RepID=UPI000BAFBB64|nr:hypothetical protein [Mesorhizobium sp. WSM3866]PBB41778.1 hypothetical protein CK222_21735 [Mesorhizobium sp. WSM3866]